MDESKHRATSPAAPGSAEAVNPDIDTVHEDRPLRIIDINEEGTHFTLIEPNLRAILARAERINPKKISIVSVVGAFRMGKSFLLDFFLRYLRSSEAEQGSPSLSLDQIPAWIQHGGERLVEGAADNEPGTAPGFLWRPGKERMTTGIWMYGKPFPRRTSSGEVIPVLLMDTQGMFDLKTSSELTASIFGLSTLISSHQVYNLSKQIQEDHLQQLDYFTQFSIVALKEFSKAQSRSKAKQAVMPAHPFQTIDFLVRDWQHFKDDGDLQGCLDEMKPALQDAINSNIKDEGTREAIKSAFETIDVFLLPHPGLNMTRAQYKGTINEIERNFLALLDVYVHRVFSDTLQPKTIQGREISPRDLLQYITAYAEVFKEGKLPKTMTLVHAISLTTNLCAKDAAVNLYKTLMKQVCGGDGACSEDDLAKTHEDAARKAIAQFDEAATFGDDAQIGFTRLALGEAIDEEYANFAEINKLKLQGNLARYIIPLIIAVVALVLDTVSDYTCDAWSNACRTASTWMALLYYIVFAVVLVEFFRIYASKGPLAVGVGAMALGQATLTRVNDITKSISRRSGLLVDNANQQSNNGRPTAQQKKTQ